jgi:hypothetical protein
MTIQARSVSEQRHSWQCHISSYCPPFGARTADASEGSLQPAASELPALWTNSFGWMHQFVYDNPCCKSRFLTPIEVWAWRPTATVPPRLAIWTLRCRRIIHYIVVFRYGERGLKPCSVHNTKPEDLSNRKIGKFNTHTHTQSAQYLSTLTHSGNKLFEF